MKRYQNLIPTFISDQYQAGKLKGKFKAYTMFVDIVGFTPLTQRLVNHGKEGSEILSDIINEVFEPATELVHNYKGFIANFEGDAFTGVFRFTDPESVLVCAARIRRRLNGYQLNDPPVLDNAESIWNRQWTIFHRQYLKPLLMAQYFYPILRNKKVHQL